MIFDEVSNITSFFPFEALPEKKIENADFPHTFKH
jgi:hypothetical protein